MNQHLIAYMVNSSVIRVSDQSRSEGFQHKHPAKNPSVLTNKLRNSLNRYSSADID